MKATRYNTKPHHEQFYQDVLAVLKRYADEHQMTAREQLAIMSNMVGKLCALQDQRTRTPDLVMAEVAKNLEEGNAQMIAELMQSKGSA